MRSPHRTPYSAIWVASAPCQSTFLSLQDIVYKDAYETVVVAKALLWRMRDAEQHNSAALRLDHVAWPEVVESARLLASTDIDEMLARLSIGFCHR